MTAERENLPFSGPATLLRRQPPGFRTSEFRVTEVVGLASDKVGQPGHVRAVRSENQRIENRQGGEITAGVITTGLIVEQVVSRLKSWSFTGIREVERTQEDARFALPSELTDENSFTGGT
jgi:hypothetical protein